MKLDIIVKSLMNQKYGMKMPLIALEKDIDVLNRMLEIKIEGIASHGGATGLNNLDFWKNKKASDFGCKYEAYDKSDSLIFSTLHFTLATLNGHSGNAITEELFVKMIDDFLLSIYVISIHWCIYLFIQILTLIDTFMNNPIMFLFKRELNH